MKDYLEVIAAESRTFLQAAQGNLGARVPSCPDWQVRDLVEHLGTVQRFHALHVPRGVTDDPTERPGPPEGDLLTWFEEGTRALLTALRQAPDSPAWNWAPHTPQTVAFWPRRMALEAAVHRWDCESAREDAHGFDVELAVDGIAEVLDVHLPADLPQEPVDVRGVVEVRLTDSDARWTLEVTGPSVVHTQKTPDAVLEGTASGVLLALWGRVPLASHVVRGDAELVAALRTG